MEKQNIIFDATVLANGNENTTARSGVFFVAYNILIELLKRDDLNVIFHSDKKQLYYVKKFVDKNFKDVKFVNYHWLYKKIAKFEFLKKECKFANESKLKLNSIRILLHLLKTLNFIRNIFDFNMYYRRELKNIDSFFSPWGLVPDYIENLNSIKKFIFVHDVIPLLFPENFPDIKKKKTELYKLYHSFNKKYNYFANSEYTKKDLLAYSDLKSENITVTYLSTANNYSKTFDEKTLLETKNKYNIPQDKKYIFSLCSLEPRKNLIFAVKNFIEFIKKNKLNDIVFVLGGGYWDIFIEALNKEISDLEDYKDKIVKIGYVEDCDLSALYSGAEMFIFPSLYEGFGMPVLEAMKCGCPVITSNVTSMPEVIGDCGIQINPKNDEDLVNALEKMYFDVVFKQKCIEAGLNRAKLFTWKDCADKIIYKIENE